MEHYSIVRAAISYARKRYAEPSNDDIEIDDPPEILAVLGNKHDANDGVWVQAWLWCPCNELEKDV